MATFNTYQMKILKEGPQPQGQHEKTIPLGKHVPPGRALLTEDDIAQAEIKLLGKRTTSPRKMRQARKALGSYFYYDLFTHWREFGPAAIDRVYKDDPSTYLRCVVAVLPKQLDITLTQYEGLSVEELRAELVQLREVATTFDDAPASKPAPTPPEPSAQLEPPGSGEPAQHPAGADRGPKTTQPKTIEGVSHPVPAIPETGRVS